MSIMVDIAAAVRSVKPSRSDARRPGRCNDPFFGVVDEVLPSEQAALGVARCQRLGHIGQHPGVFACQYLIAVEIAPISQNSDLLVSCRLLRLERHRHELGSVMAEIGHFVRHDQVVLDANRGLHIVADDAGAFAAGRHCASIWIGQRDLPIRRGLNGDLHLSQVLHLLLKAGELVLAGKQLYAIALADRGIMALAGLWENWRSPAGERVRSFAIVTTRPNELCAELHDRMPVVLAPEAWPVWLGEAPADPSHLKALLAPYPAEGMTCWPVSPRVGNVKNNDPSLVEPIAA
jgi:SOS response associated peptidase (SRAP)